MFKEINLTQGPINMFC